MITGASSGIGKPCSLAFAKAGAKTVIAARRETQLKSLQSDMEALGGEATYVVTDVSNSLDVENMVAHAIGRFGRLDFAVNNAGIEGKYLSLLTCRMRRGPRSWTSMLKALSFA